MEICFFNSNKHSLKTKKVIIERSFTKEFSELRSIKKLAVFEKKKLLIIIYEEPSEMWVYDYSNLSINSTETFAVEISYFYFKIDNINSVALWQEKSCLFIAGASKGHGKLKCFDFSNFPDQSSGLMYWYKDLAETNEFSSKGEVMMINFNSENKWLFLMFKNGYLDILDFTKTDRNELKNPKTNNLDLKNIHFDICHFKKKF